MKKYISRLKTKDYFRRYLQVAPLALAVFRTIEAKNIAEVEMERPILDIGCGFGEFAGVFFKSQVELGLDLSWSELINARKGNRYKNLIWADARELPFADNYFKTVLSVSVLEHANGVETILKETFRVLKPGGIFVFTTNTKKINRLLKGPAVFRRIGGDTFSQGYLNFYHWLFKHRTLWEKDRWEEEIKKAGFEVIKIKEIISPKATQTFELFIWTAWPSQMIKLFIGRRWAWRPEWFREWLIEHFSPLIEEESGEGSNLFVVARKKDPRKSR